MLNLLYYDFLAVFKKLWYYVLIITGLAFVVRILWSEAFLTLFDNSNFFIGLVIRYVALGFLCAFGVLIVVIAIMVQAQWFDENILSAQGQLTNMYPVSSVQLVMSKVINSFIWAFILSLVAVGVFSVFCVGTDVFKGMVEAIADLSTNNNIKISFGSIISTSCFFVATATVNLISLCYLSQTIGQVFANFKNLMVLVSFVAICVVVLLLLYIIFSAFGVVHLFNEAIANKQSETVVRLVMSMGTRFSFINILLSFFYGFMTGCILRARLNIM